MSDESANVQKLIDECDRLMRLFDDAGIYSVAIGSLAMRKLGLPRVPKDIDIAIDRQLPLARKILESDGYVKVGFVGLTFEKAGFSVDLIFETMAFPIKEVKAYDYDQLPPGVEHPSKFGSRCGWATAEGLILSKSKLDEEKHKNDIAELTRLIQGGKGESLGHGFCLTRPA